MNKLSSERRATILTLLCEGSSLRAVTRITGVSINTVTKLLIDAGKVCSEYQDRVFRELPCKRLQVDEIWSFVYAKAKNVPAEMKADPGVGDVWTWTAICADTKLIPSWLVGSRDGNAASAFISDLASRLSNRVQLTSDGHSAYLSAVESAFGADVDYAQLVKVYGAAPESAKGRYSPPGFVAAHKTPVTGSPDPKHVSTSFAERSNLTMRMHMRRFTRLTNAFSKKVEYHAYAVALHMMFYNFVRMHKTLRCSPAMAAGVTTKLWDMSDVVALIEEAEDRKPEAPLMAAEQYEEIAVAVEILTWMAAAFGCGAALLWFKATVVTVIADSNSNEFQITEEKGGKRVDVLETADRQTWWNRWAAAAASIAALCQAAALAFLRLSN